MSPYKRQLSTVALAVAGISMCLSPAFSQKSATPASTKSKEAAPSGTAKSSAKPAKSTTDSAGASKAKGSTAASKSAEHDCCEEDAKKTNRAEALKRGGTTPAQSAVMMPRTVSINAHEFSVTGEVVDTWCFASKAVLNGRGPEHYKCADACAHGGVTLGIVDDKDTLYIAAKTKAYQGCQYLLEPFVARRVVAKGWLSQAGGCNIMKIDKITLATDKPQPVIPGVK